MAPSGPPERGPLARLAQATSCPVCGGPLRDPLLLPCNHSCCRRCLPRALPPPSGSSRDPSPRSDTGALPLGAVSCPRCHLLCPPGRLRTPVALAVECRIVERLRGTPRAPRRGQRASLGAQLRADAAVPPTPPTPPLCAPAPEEPPQSSGPPPQ